MMLGSQESKDWWNGYITDPKVKHSSETLCLSWQGNKSFRLKYSAKSPGRIAQNTVLKIKHEANLFQVLKPSMISLHFQMWRWSKLISTAQVHQMISSPLRMMYQKCEIKVYKSVSPNERVPEPKGMCLPDVKITHRYHFSSQGMADVVGWRLQNEINRKTPNNLMYPTVWYYRLIQHPNIAEERKATSNEVLCPSRPLCKSRLLYPLWGSLFVPLPLAPRNYTYNKCPNSVLSCWNFLSLWQNIFLINILF